MALTYKLKGNTLAEVLIALAITSFCATLAVIIYLNIQQSTMPFIRIKSNELAEKYMMQSISKKEFTDDAFKEEEYVIKRRVSRNQLYGECADILLRVYDADKKLLTELRTTVHAY